jgi:hypothetical protein
MKKLLKDYWLTALLIAAPLIRHFSENSTIDALAGVAVWGTMWLIFVCACIVALIGVACHVASDSITINDGFEKLHGQFRKLKWWKSAITVSLVLGTMIYVDWPGPAVLYTINMALMWGGFYAVFSGVEKVCEANGIELPEPEVDEKEDLKKSLL